MLRICMYNNYIIISFICMYNVQYQAEAWISEKISVATDESYKDPTNLKAKLQKHQAFEAEITANEERIQTLAKVRKKFNKVIL